MFTQRLIQFIRQQPDSADLFDGDSDHEVLQQLRDDPDLLEGLIRKYKWKRWNRHLEIPAPATSLQQVERMGRKGDEKMLVLCGWHNEEGGLSGECAYCQIPLELHEVTVDHVEPRSKGGLDSLSNLVPACLDCNKTKADRSAEEYLRDMGFEDEAISEWKASLNDANEFRKQAGLCWEFRLSEDQVGRLGIDRK